MMKTRNFNKAGFTFLRKAVGIFYLAAFLLCVAVVAAQAQDAIIWEQSYAYGAGGVRDFGPSNKWDAGNVNSELADDFDLVGTISRVDVVGYTDGFTSPTVSSSHYSGIIIKFYAVGADNKPGALQSEQFIPKTSPNFVYQGSGLGDVRVRLETPFQATGRHFLTVQLVINPNINEWYWRSSDNEPIRGEAPYFRANPNAPWGRDTYNDGSRNLGFRLWGTRVLTAAPTISGISNNNLPQAGRLKITGTNFGTTQGAGTVRIGGANAPVSSWSETAITAYVSDASAIGAGSVEVITDGGTSNAKPLTIRARSAANGRVLWRFQADDLYVRGRPAVGADGTIYAAGVGGHLYALTPNGGVKWIFRGKFPVVQSVSVGADNVSYFTGGNVIYAINPDGSLKWQITNPTGASVAAGPNVGPDGNIYAVFDLGSTTNPQMGAITISSAGQILNDRRGYLEPRGTAYGSREIVFGSNQFYFGGLNNVVFNTTGMEFFALGGNYIRTVSAGGGQPAVAPDGTVYNILGANPDSPPRLGAFSPTSGNLLRTILTQETYLSTPDIGADGTIYAAHNLTTLSGYTPSGANLWNFTPNGSIYGSPIVNSQNTVVSVSGYDYAEPGVIYGVSNAGQSLWTVNFPAENGGYVRAISRARFTPDGSTVYYGTDVNDYANDVYSYLYAISAAPVVPCSFGITPDFANFQYNGGSGNISIAATNSNCAWTAASNASWITVYNQSGTGSGTAAYTVTANPNFTTRTGTIIVGGQTFTVTQGARTTTTQVSITSPASGAVFTLPTNIFVSANANNASGTISRVEFYANNQLIGTDTSAPYQIVWNDPAATAYNLVAKSFDQNGAVTLSEAVTITVYPVPPPEPAPLPIPPPTLTSPTANQIFNAGESITFNAVPGSSQYPAARVEFYLDATLVGSDDTAPYSFTLNNAPGGIYSVSARTVTNTGARATSQPIDIRVNADRINVGAKSFDFDGDGKADVSVFRPSNGAWYINRSANGFTGLTFGFGTDKPVPADYDGDGKTDVAVFRDGNWYYLKSSNDSFVSLQWGLNTDIPIPADFDGDGKADVNVFRPSDGGWYRINSSNGQFFGTQFGQNGDKPLIADFDGDGKSDIAVFRPAANGFFYWLDSSTGNFRALAFGFGTDIPTLGDYDGDGKTDVAVFRPSNGAWYRRNSSSGAFFGTLFGSNGDVPAAADYDGDGKTDIAVFRNGNWYRLNSSNSQFAALIFGFGTDKPIPAVF